MNNELWEILVPASNSKRKENFSYAHHKEFDDYVKSLSNGLTILKTVKGEWMSDDGELFVDRLIPVRIATNRENIDKIIDFTITHYNQLAVMAYKISEEVIIRSLD
jgi:hypothetical protein